MGRKKETYMQALNWSVDEFFKQLLPQLDLLNEEIILIYTSDHGQGLGQDGSYSTHCLPRSPRDVQARVPLLIFFINFSSPTGFRRLMGEYSQFQIFSSVLTMMGFDGQQISLTYGPDLSRPWEGERFFYSGDLSGRGQLSKNLFLY